MVKRTRQIIDKPRRQLERFGMAHLEGRRIIHLRHLVLHRLNDLVAPVPGVAAPKARRAVQHLTPVIGRVVHVLGADEQARIALELPVGCERHPEGFHIVQALGIGGH